MTKSPPKPELLSDDFPSPSKLPKRSSEVELSKGLLYDGDKIKWKL